MQISGNGHIFVVSGTMTIEEKDYNHLLFSKALDQVIESNVEHAMLAALTFFLFELKPFISTPSNFHYIYQLLHIN